MSPGDSASVKGLRVSFQEELDALQANLQEESDLVLRSLRGAINALEQRDVELADEVIAFDDEVDERYLCDRPGDRAATGAADAGRRSTCAWCSPCSTSTWASSGWPTSA